MTALGEEGLLGLIGIHRADSATESGVDLVVIAVLVLVISKSKWRAR